MFNANHLLESRCLVLGIEMVPAQLQSLDLIPDSDCWVEIVIGHQHGQLSFMLQDAFSDLCTHSYVTRVRWSYIQNFTQVAIDYLNLVKVFNLNLSTFCLFDVDQSESCLIVNLSIRVAFLAVLRLLG